MTWLQTFTARRFEFETPGDISVVDIAHALALTNRFSGHTRVPYSVAEHSCRVAVRAREIAGGNLDAMRAGLLHDAAEAYVGDMVRPLKTRIEMGAYGWLERRILRVIWDRFLPQGGTNTALEWARYDDVVARADRELLATEARDLLVGGPREDWGVGDPLAMEIEPLHWQGAERWYLDQWSGLWPEDQETEAVRARLAELRGVPS